MWRHCEEKVAGAVDTNSSRLGRETLGLGGQSEQSRKAAKFNSHLPDRLQPLQGDRGLARGLTTCRVHEILVASHQEWSENRESLGKTVTATNERGHTAAAGMTRRGPMGGTWTDGHPRRSHSILFNLQTAL